MHQLTGPLAHWRSDRVHWTTLAHTADDSSAPAREAVLDLLAADRRDTDAEFLRYLLAQEIALHRESWGYHDSLGLAALLLAECREVADVWQLWQAKTATVDTFTGVDCALLCGAGVEATLAHVRSVDHPDRADLLDYLTERAPTEQEVADVLGGLRAYHRG